MTEDNFVQNIMDVGAAHPEILDRDHPISEVIEHVLTDIPELVQLSDGFDIARRIAMAKMGRSEIK